jgi:hypothetical protein
MKKIVISLVSLFLLAPSMLYAQAIDNFSVTLNPKYPKEFEKVTISLDSFSFNLDKSKITWKENGVVVAEGTGLKTKSFTAPANGKSKKIRMSVFNQNGYLLEKELNLAPQTVDLLWEATDTYTPPFYKGKALPSEQSIIKVVAIPNFVENDKVLDRSKVIFTWSLNDIQRDSFSGFGQNFFPFKMDPLEASDLVKVKASSYDSSSSVENSIYIPKTSPEIVIYEENPLLGVLWDRAFTGGIRLSSNETTFVAEPYFFSGKKNIADSLNFSWTVGGVVNKESTFNKLTVRRPSDSGSTNIGIYISHINKILQEAEKKIPIVYGQ